MKDYISFWNRNINSNFSPKNKISMFSKILKVSVIALIIALQSCSGSEIQVANVSFEVSEEFLQQFREIAEKNKRASDKLEEKGIYKDIELSTMNEFSTDSESTNTLLLVVQYDKTLESTDETLKAMGKEAFQIVIDALQNEKPYDKYDIKFLQDASGDREDEKNFRNFVYTIDELETTNQIL